MNSIKDLETIKEVYEVIQDKLAELSTSISETEIEECEKIKLVLESLQEGIESLSLEEKCSFFGQFAKDIDSLVENRQGLTRDLKTKVKAIEQKFLPCVKGLESIKYACSESISKDVLSNLDKYQNDKGKISFKHGDVTIKEGSVKRKYTITDISKIPAKYLQLNEEAIDKYIDLLGEAPEGIEFTETRSCSLVVKRK